MMALVYWDTYNDNSVVDIQDPGRDSFLPHRGVTDRSGLSSHFPVLCWKLMELQ